MLNWTHFTTAILVLTALTSGQATYTNPILNKTGADPVRKPVLAPSLLLRWVETSKET